MIDVATFGEDEPQTTGLANLLAEESRLRRRLADATAAVHEELARLARELCPYREGDIFSETNGNGERSYRVAGIDGRLPHDGSMSLSPIDVAVNLLALDGPCTGEIIPTSLATINRMVREGSARMDRKEERE